MNRYNADISTLFVVEQQLLNAAVSLRSAERRLGNGELREEIRAILRSVETTADLTKRAHRIVLKEWRSVEVTPSAA